MKAIEFENVGKQYRLGLVSTGTISHDLNRWWTMNVLHKEDPYLKIGETNDRSQKGHSDYVWALKDINFSIEEGDVVGIIGKNGAGKSTLLKLLSRVTSPTTGLIRAKGRIASLLEVGTGFHPEMTGRENIYLNGAIMGMTKAEISRKLDEIVDFSGCERYIDTPVKRYSSGMTVRLGFAIAAHLEPEILVVDEVLAVGDAEFQKKAIGKMQDISKGGSRTVLFVSHNMAAVRSLCKSGIVLNNGMVEYSGTALDSVNYYLSKATNQNVGDYWKKDLINEAQSFQLISAGVYDEKNELKTSFECDEPVNIDMEVLIKEQVPNIYGWFGILNCKTGEYVWVSDSNDIIMNKLQSIPVGKHKIRLTIPKRSIAPGEYLITVNFQSDHNISGFTMDRNEEFLKFDIHDYNTERGDKRTGYFSTLLDWQLID